MNNKKSQDTGGKIGSGGGLPTIMLILLCIVMSTYVPVIHHLTAEKVGDDTVRIELEPSERIDSVEFYYDINDNGRADTYIKKIETPVNMVSFTTVISPDEVEEGDTVRVRVIQDGDIIGTEKVKVSD